VHCRSISELFSYWLLHELELDYLSAAVAIPEVIETFRETEKGKPRVMKGTEMCHGSSRQLIDSCNFQASHRFKVDTL